MPISYDSTEDFTKSLGKTGTAIGYVNKLSPSGYSNADVNSLLSSGLSPDDITKRFSNAYSQAAASYDPFPSDTSKIQQLQGVYGQVPQAYDVSGTLSAMSNARKRNLNVGETAANTSAQKFQESQLPGSANQLGAGVVRAQSLLPFLKQDSTDALTQGQYGDTAKQNALSASASIANQLAQLQQTYTQALATYNANKATQNLDYANKLASLALDSSYKNQTSTLDWYKSQAQIAESARQANLSASLKNREMDLNAAQTANNQSINASNVYLQNAKAPTGYWTTNNQGQVTGGKEAYNAYQDYQRGRSSALSNILNLS